MFPFKPVLNRYFIRLIIGITVAWVLSFFRAGTLVAQEATDSSVILKGLVLDADSMTPIFPVHILLNGQQGVINRPDGQFYLPLRIGDHLRFSYVGYKTVNLQIADSLGGMEYIAGIFMSPDTLSIREVVIMPRLRPLRQEIMSISPSTDPELENARRNIQISAYQGLNQMYQEMDADMNHDAVQQRYLSKSMNLGLISHDQIVPLTAILPMAYFMIMKASGKLEPQEMVLSPLDIDRIRELLRKEKQKNKHLPPSPGG